MYNTAGGRRGGGRELSLKGDNSIQKAYHGPMQQGGFNVTDEKHSVHARKTQKCPPF
jgi:hypothetical protein